MDWMFQQSQPSSLRAKPSAWMFQPLPPLLHKERPRPQPKALPLSRGRDATAPTRRSFIKVLLPKVGRREISYATELRLFCVRSAHLNEIFQIIFVTLITDMHEASLYPTFFFGGQAFGLGVTTTPTPSWPKKGLQPQPPYSGSVIKVLLPKVGRREISYATELRLFVFATLT